MNYDWLLQALTNVRNPHLQDLEGIKQIPPEALTQGIATHVSGYAGMPMDLAWLAQSGINKGMDMVGMPNPYPLGELKDTPMTSDWMADKAGIDVNSLEYLMTQAASPDVGALIKAPGMLKAMMLFHGSPHKWDKPDLSRVGTGEGAQAYGHGFYAAENPKVANEYATQLSQNQPVYDGEVSPEAMDSIVQAWRSSDYDDPSKLPDGELREWLDVIAEDIDHGRAIDDEVSGRIADEILALDPKKLRMGEGNLYELDVPDEAIGKMLDWDKPLSEQGDHVRRIVQENFADDPDAMNMTGEELYKRMVQDIGEDSGYAEEMFDETLSPLMRKYDITGDIAPLQSVQEFAAQVIRDHGRRFTKEELDSVQPLINGRPDLITSKYLNSLGIPGIKYLDGSSRTAGEGTRNYVIFSEDNVKPLTRNGEPLSPGNIEAPGLERAMLEAKTGSVMRDSTEVLKDRKRTAFPGIYKDARQLAEEAESMVAPEDPAMKQLFGVNRDELAEIGMHGKRKGNIDPQIPGLAKNPKGADSAKNVMTPQNTDRLVEALSQAEISAPNLVKGMDSWYVMDPLYWKFVEYYGPEKAADEYSRFNTLSGMSSAGSDVLTEINRGTGANMLHTQGRFDDFMKYGGVAESNRGADFPDDMRAIKGHAYHPTAQARPMQQYLDTGANQQKSPKVPMYIQASGVPETGFQTSMPVGDAHFSRAIGLADTRGAATRKGKEVIPGASITTPELSDIGPWWRDDVAGQIGIEAVPGQARAWGIYAPQTGVETAIGAPKLELLARQVMTAAKRMDVPPEKALEMIITGKAHAGNIDPKLLALMGGTGAGAAVLAYINGMTERDGT